MANFRFVRSNIFQVDRTSTYFEGVHEFRTAIQIRCPHCGVVGMFPPAIPYSVKYPKHISANQPTLSMFSASVHICPNADCAGLVFLISDGKASLVSCPPESIDFQSDGIPPRLVNTLKEAISCHSVEAYRASAMLVRRLLEEICHENGAQGRSLHNRIENLKSKVTLSNDLFEAMGELKLLGNDAAHVEARDYDVIDEDESSVSIELGKELLKALYQHKPLVARLRSLKKTP